ncbi:MAG: tetratricopeptide repeat protein, partial [Acidobacteria bacterium]|nr:tetratricopeptide repeat protein [Acidobacteriota bacterium]
MVVSKHAASTLLAILILVSLPILAQKTPAPAPSPGPATRGPTSPTPPTVQTPSQRSPNDSVLFINGRVAMDDGTPLPSNILVDRVCNGQTRQQVHADMKGNFSFQLGTRFNDVSNDVTVTPQFGSSVASSDLNDGFSTSNNANQMGVSRQALWSCEIRAEAGGMRSASAALQAYSPGQTIDVGTIFLQRGEKAQGTTISATSYQAPKDAKKAYEKGMEAARKGNVAEAEKQLEKATQIYPQFATAWYYLGMVHERQKEIEPAKKAYEQATAADAKYVAPYIQLAMLAAVEGNWKDALRYSDTGIQLDPLDYPAAYYFNSLANYRLNNLEAAEKGARSVERYDQQHRFPQVHVLLGSILSQNKAYAEAITEFSAYLKMVPDSKDADAVRAKVASLEKAVAATA